MSALTVIAAATAISGLLPGTHWSPAAALAAPHSPHALLQRAFPAPPSATATTASLRWQGFEPQPPSQLGAVALQAADGGIYGCSGTLVSRSVILTAAHCVYRIGAGYDRRLVFAPGMRSAGAGIATPYGVFAARRLWAPAAYRHGHALADFAFVELAPRADGALPGDVAGVARTAASTRFRRGERVVEMGYPGEGFFATAAGHYGRDPYACDTTVSRILHVGRYRAVASRCTMNGGASGGPWFALRGGVPIIVGINDWCQGPHRCRPFARRVLSSWFGHRYRALWRRVVTSGAA